MITIELDIFSGRTNPSWSLNGAEEIEFTRMISGLRPAAETVALPGLGYRGFLVTEKTGAHFRIFQGRRFKDVETEEVIASSPDTSLEGWLLDTAKSAIDESLLTAVRRQLRQSGSR